MDRMTKRIDEMVWLRCDYEGRTLFLEPYEIKTEYQGTSYIKKMLARLAAYEDTGLTPAEITSMQEKLRATQLE